MANGISHPIPGLQSWEARRKALQTRAEALIYGIIQMQRKIRETNTIARR